MDALPGEPSNSALQACKSCLIKDFSDDCWREIHGSLDIPPVTPYVNLGTKSAMLPFFYVEFKLDHNINIGYNELATDLLHALYKMRGLRQYLKQLVSALTIVSHP